VTSILFVLDLCPSPGRIPDRTNEHQYRARPHHSVRLAAIHGDAEKERHGFAYGQDERHRERRHTPGEPVDANDAKQLCHRVREEVQERGRQHERDGRERDGRTGHRPGEFGRDALPGEIKEGEGKEVDVEHVFLPRGLCEGVGCGGLDVARKDIVLGESEESGEEEGEAEDGDALCVKRCDDIGWVCMRDGFGF
jgi:hypothetical protein